MRYCKDCLQPDTRPNIKFSKSGICPACVYYSKYLTVDWSERSKILTELVDKYRNPSSQYDCIIGVSGGKDSTRQALWIRDYLKMRPLLVCLSYPPHQMTELGASNISSLIELGFDVIQSYPAPETWRALMKVSFMNYGNWAKSTELALFASVPKLAIDFKIPLILWGENPGLQVGDMNTLGRKGFDGNNLREMNTLGGGDYSWMRKAGFNEKDIIPYRYPSYKEMKKHKINIVYLGWFLGDWSFINNAKISGVNGLSLRDDSVQNTGDLYGVSALDEDWVGLNQMIKFYKFGFGKTTDYVNEMIRQKKISRKDGIKLVKKYDGVCSEKYIEDFCSYLDISNKIFWKVVKDNTSKTLFNINHKSNIITPKFTVGEGI